jgi:hypothetical protein
MKRLITCLLSFLFACTAFAQGKISAALIGDHIDISTGDMFFTSYRFSDSEKYPFFFPVNGPVSGASLTSMRNGLYPHHSSLFFGCDMVNGGNYWQDGLERGRIVSLGAQIVKQGGDSAVIADYCIWKRPDAEAPIIDRRLITVTNPAKGLIFIDFDIEMTMLADVVIPKTNHSLFSLRVADDISALRGGVMRNAEGLQGEKDTFGKASPWMDCSATRVAGAEGIALMQHPQNRWFPSPWFTRDYGFISPTPMYWPEDEESTAFKKGETLRLRYRVAIHAGDAEQADVNRLFAEYAANEN